MIIIYKYVIIINKILFLNNFRETANNFRKNLAIYERLGTTNFVDHPNLYTITSNGQ